MACGAETVATVRCVVSPRIRRQSAATDCRFARRGLSISVGDSRHRATGTLQRNVRKERSLMSTGRFRRALILSTDTRTCPRRVLLFPSEQHYDAARLHQPLLSPRIPTEAERTDPCIPGTAYVAACSTGGRIRRSQQRAFCTSPLAKIAIDVPCCRHRSIIVPQIACGRVRQLILPRKANSTCAETHRSHRGLSEKHAISQMPFPGNLCHTPQFSQSSPAVLVLSWSMSF